MGLTGRFGGPMSRTSKMRQTAFFLLTIRDLEVGIDEGILSFQIAYVHGITIKKRHIVFLTLPCHTIPLRFSQLSINHYAYLNVSSERRRLR